MFQLPVSTTIASVATTSVGSSTQIRPAREFPNITALSNMISSDPQLKSANITSLLLTLLSSLNDASTTIPKNEPVLQRVNPLNSLSQLSASDPKISSKTNNSQPNFLFLSPLAAVNSSTVDSPINVKEPKATNQTESHNVADWKQTIWDLFQIAVARVPSPADSGFVVSPRPLFRSLLRPSRPVGSDTGQNSLPVKRDESPSVTDFLLSRQNSSLDLSMKPSQDQTNNLKEHLNVPALVVPMLLSGLERLPPLSGTAASPKPTATSLLIPVTVKVSENAKTM
jgi:hypothetical protein